MKKYISLIVFFTCLFTGYVWAGGINNGGGSSTSAGISIGTSTITGGTSPYILYNNAGVVGNEQTVPVANGGTASTSLGNNLCNTNSVFNICQPTSRQVITTSDTISSADCGGIINYNNSSAIAVTLPVASTSGLTQGCGFTVNNISTGITTITPTTSTINGKTTLTVLPSNGCYIYSDSTNWQVDKASCNAANVLTQLSIGTSASITSLTIQGQPTSFSALQPKNTVGIGYINDTATLWTGNGLYMTNAATGSSDFSLVLDGDILYFGSPTSSAAVWSKMNSTGLLVGSSGTITNTLDVKGKAAFGTYGGSSAAPSNSIIVSGGIGVGTTALSFSKLNVSDTGSSYTGVVPIGFSAIGKINNTGSAWVGNGFVFGDGTTGSADFSLVFDGDIAYFGGASTGTNWINMRPAGIGIGTNTLRNSAKLDVHGAINVDGATSYFSGLNTSSATQTGTMCVGDGGLLTVDTTTTCLLSSMRFKRNIEPSTFGLAEVMKMQPKTFYYKDDRNGEINLKRQQIGFIAEDMQKVVPDLVALEPDGKTPKSVAYQNLTAVLVSAIQEQQKEIDELKKKVH